MADQSIQDIIPENDQTRARHEHLEALRQLVGNVYPNKFERSQVVEAGREDTITAIVEKFRSLEPQVSEGDRPAAEEIAQINGELNKVTVRLAGRIAAPPRVMGKAAFLHLSDGAERLQIYVKKADVKAVNNNTGELIEEEGKGWELFGLLDHGDFIGVSGFLFVTKTGELSVHVQTLQFLAKALLPMPDKMHGINDPEIRQRQRYADLIAGSLKLSAKAEEPGAESKEHDEPETLTTRQVFERRSAVIRELRRFLEDHGYVEVETPMLTPLATGAAAKPFKTHHNALDIDLFARIAPELYLKRLLVGGFEKVYELNRNFRNEGISARHNPEFTMLEFYWAYADVNQMMDFCEQLLRTALLKALGRTTVKFGEQRFDFSQPFRRITMKEAIAHYCVSVGFDDFGLNQETVLGLLDSPTGAQQLHGFLMEFDSYTERAVGELGDESSELDLHGRAWAIARRENSEVPLPSPGETSRQIAQMFENLEDLLYDILVGPTFIYDFPKAISPLSKSSPKDPSVAERFELYIAGMEVANGFSELNDPAEQFRRFNDQVEQREQGDEEAMVMDEDYIRALSYGMPPAAGIGIGIDRFTMLLTNRQSIRDVILFPHLRPERKREEQEPPALE